jgi:hypothetical protein
MNFSLHFRSSPVRDAKSISLEKRTGRKAASNFFGVFPKERATHKSASPQRVFSAATSFGKRLSGSLCEHGRLKDKCKYCNPG